MFKMPAAGDVAMIAQCITTVYLYFAQKYIGGFYSFACVTVYFLFYASRNSPYMPSRAKGDQEFSPRFGVGDGI